MKLREYRNSTIKSRLEHAAKDWLSEDPKRSFREPETISFSRIIKWLLAGLGIALLSLFLWVAEGDGPIFLAIILPVLAIRTFFQVARIQATPASLEATHVLPLDDQTLTRQVRANLKAPLLQGIFLAASMGTLAAGPGVSLTGAFQAALIHLSIFGCLTLSYYGVFFSVFSFLAKASAVLLFASMVISRLREFTTFLIEGTPWFRAFDSPLHLALLTVSGIFFAWFTRNRWSKVSYFNRTALYEDSPSTDSEVETDLEPEGMVILESDPTPLLRHPKGLLEQFVWRRLTIKERGLLRGVRGHTGHFLSSWIKLTLFFLAVVWLTRFEWPASIEKFRPIAPFLSLLSGFFACGMWISPPTQYLNALILGPQTTVARFQAIPITLSTLEKLMWKEGFLRWFLIALTIAIAPFIRQPDEASFQVFCSYLLIAFAFIQHIFWLHFWNASINGWTPRKGRGKGWALLIETVIVLGIFMTIGCAIPFVAVFKIGDQTSQHSAFWIPITIIITYQMILRTLVRTFISDTRADLIRQV